MACSRQRQTHLGAAARIFCGRGIVRRVLLLPPLLSLCCRLPLLTRPAPLPRPRVACMCEGVAFCECMSTSCARCCRLTNDECSDGPASVLGSLSGQASHVDMCKRAQLQTAAHSVSERVGMPRACASALRSSFR